MIERPDSQDNGITGGSPPAGVMTFAVSARSGHEGLGEARVHGGDIVRFDASAGKSVDLPSPADLLTAAFAACTLKNVARFAQILDFTYQEARIEVVSQRQDSPPRISGVDWTLHITTSDPPERLRLLQTNIERQGTIYNTVAAAAEVTGRIVISPAAGKPPE